MNDHATLLERIAASYGELNELIDSLDEAGLNRSTGSWTIKDQLSHIALWERTAIATLQGVDPVDLVAIDRAAWESGDDDTINGAWQQAHAADSAATVVSDFRTTHDQLMSILNGLGDEDLGTPLRDGSPRTLADKIAANTYDHYDEHRAIIVEALEAASA